MHAVTPDPASFESIPGKGVGVSYSGREILFGNTRVLEAFGVNQDANSKAKLDELRSEGKAAMILAVDRKIVGIVGAADTIKEHAMEAAKALQRMKLG